MHRQVMNPLVNQLNTLFYGSELQIGNRKQRVWAMLMLCSCDIPAWRKIGGICNIGCYFMCSKRDKKYSITETTIHGEEKKRVYCGDFNMQAKRRTVEDHRRCAMKWLSAKNDIDADQVVSNTGFW